ncbi:uncharacterized protein ARMOST_07683 [Armillaria ostoyae]|uniref:Uncharacterized protein n=1 Tax=Armillaria ostoyae TaxID=47428 RepID=A0A284R6G5_ARMOS|nr:uncharacterized protein ARMOST_07683 [Armillaria ostoyae]
MTMTTRIALNFLRARSMSFSFVGSRTECMGWGTRVEGVPIVFADGRLSGEMWMGETAESIACELDERPRDTVPSFWRARPISLLTTHHHHLSCYRNMLLLTMTTLMMTEELPPAFGQMEGLNITNDFICLLLSPDYLPPSAAPTAMKPVRSIQSSGVLAVSKIKTTLTRKRKADSEPLSPRGPSTSSNYPSSYQNKSYGNGDENKDPSSHKDVNLI